MDHESEIVSDVSRFVAMGNDQALVRAIKGDLAGALADLDEVRDEAMKMEQDSGVRNEIECRRLEVRLLAAGAAKDLALFADCLYEMGSSDRFTKERLSFFCADSCGAHSPFVQIAAAQNRPMKTG